MWWTAEGQNGVGLMHQEVAGPHGQWDVGRVSVKGRSSVLSHLSRQAAAARSGLPRVGYPLGLSPR